MDTIIVLAAIPALSFPLEQLPWLAPTRPALTDERCIPVCCGNEGWSVIQRESLQPRWSFGQILPRPPPELITDCDE